MVYFIETNINQIKYVKIGRSHNPRTRLQDLQTGCPVPLKLLFAKNGDENYFHKIFQKYRCQGEWFLMEGELEKFIERHMPIYSKEAYVKN